ncbi:hypothetical protein P3T76_015579 [Phytophthora citrophthora]|uniref:Uncharacterized protein n=1 Tax=Phytophthora citrophthora TaxID=4793 RepID=A0AAD9FZ49_9STRA|nr:hypothetical protein P3T76_015564 [Phytophthora citrophthora]KAK1928939.1 hypothetical protein P3T76_015579 [Phytophthora citrophthora]
MQLNKAAKEVFVSTMGSATRFPPPFQSLGPFMQHYASNRGPLGSLDTVEALVTAIVDENPSLRRLSSLLPMNGNCYSLLLQNQDFRGLLRWLRKLQLVVGSCLVDAELSVKIENLFSTRLVPIQQLCSIVLGSSLK